MKFLLLALIIVFINLGCVFSQSRSANESNSFKVAPDSLFVSKIKCNCESNGYNLIIQESLAGADNFCSPFSYNLLFSSSDYQKIDLIQKLLMYSNDTSNSCINLKCYSTKAFKKYGNEFSSYKLNIQVMALYHINLICFAQFSVFKYSPYPILYDTIENKIINNDFEKMKEVFQIYKNWFEENKESEFKNFSFPLFNSRYKWIHGNYEEKLSFNELPSIISDYKDRIGKPVNDEY